MRRAAAEASDAELKTLNALIDRQEKFARAGDLSGFLELDEAFHRNIAIAADCEHAWHIVEDLKVQFDRVRLLSLPQATPIKTLVDQHRAIADALAQRDPARAEQAMARASRPKAHRDSPALIL